MDVKSFPYNPIVEKIVNVLMTKTQNYNPHFFRLQTNFFLTLVPSLMHIRIDSPITGKIPVNFYGVNASLSGSGKGFSTNVLEEQVLKEFRNAYMYDSFPKKSQLSLEIEATNRAAALGVSPDEALTQLQKEFRSYGKFKFSFDDATVPAIKQLRSSIILAKTGSINLIIDELGNNLQKSLEPLTAMLELYDKGFIRDKLTKNTETSIRFQELIGSTPSNLLMFGTPSKFLNGGKIEDDFFDLMETGYARRCFFGYATKVDQQADLTPEQLYDMLSQQNHEQDLAQISRKLMVLSDVNLMGMTLKVPRDVGIELMAYRQFCEERAKDLADHQEVQKAELVHRYFKALKLAGTYTFINGQRAITKEYLHQAIRFTEDSGEALARMFTREKPYERLAKFIAGNQGKELTQVDLANDLPFYKGSQTAKNEMMNMAIAYGIKNNIIIKKKFNSGVEFFSGETLKETDLSKIIVSYSQSFSDNYYNDTIPWDKLNLLTMKDINNLPEGSEIQAGFNWLNHHSTTGHRSNQDMAVGFNCVVLDIDSGVKVNHVKELLKDYTWFIHTTKRHLEDGVTERFRLVMPISHELKLSEPEFKEFMQNISNWLPFSGLDEKTFQRSRKWSCHNGEEHWNEGQLLNALNFIPDTQQEQEFKKSRVTLENLNNLERWFAQGWETGSRNNILANYGFMLMDNGFSEFEIATKLIEFNSKLSNPLDKTEIETTILTSIRNRRNNG